MSERKKRGARPQPWGDAKPQDLAVVNELPRLRVEYGKDERLAYLGHLEVIETVMRCIRRASLPFSIGNGFARRMRIQFSQALPVGASSACEYFDLRLNEPMDVDEAMARLIAATPAALAPKRAAFIEGPAAALESWLTRAGWEVVVADCAVGAKELSERIEALREQGELTYLRGEKVKHVDISRALVSFEARPCEAGVALTLDTRSSNEGALRPQILVDAALGCGASVPEGAPLAYDCLKVRRTWQAHEDANSGRLVKPL